MTRFRQYWLFGTAVFVLLLALAAIFATRPAATLAALQLAAQTRDVDALERLVDFPAVRDSVKTDLLHDLALRDDESAPAGERIGAFLGSLLAGPMIDIVVSPRGLAYLLEGYSPVETIRHARPGARGEIEPRKQVSYQTRWDSLSSYSITINEDGAPLSMLVLQRYGLFQWKLAYLDLTPPAVESL